MLTAALMFVLQSSDRARTLVQLSDDSALALAASPSDSSKIASLQAKTQVISHQLLAATWMMLALIVGLWAVSTIVRRWGWQSEAELKPVIGITIPLIFGVMSLFSVMLVASQ